MKPLALILALFPLIAEERAQVTGLVQDASGGVLADAALTVINEDTGIRRSARSGPEGEYAVGALPAGIYKITARKPGFQTIARLDVTLTAGQNTRVDFTMQVGSMRELVTVRGSPAAINADDASAGTRAPSHLLDALPATGGGILNIVELAPGVIATPAAQGEAGQFTVNGQRQNGNYFTVDGVSANTGVSGSATPAQFSGGTLPAMTAFGSTETLSPDEAIDEVRVETSSFAPEFGHAPGAHVEISTRSGTNELHGALFATARSQTFDANDWFRNSTGLGRAPAAFFNGGATLGGPIRRDRTFVFAAYEMLRMSSPYTWEAAVPSLSSRNVAPARLRPLLNAFPLANGPPLANGLAEFTASASRPARFDAGTLRIDHALTARISLFARYQQTPSSAQSGFAQVDHSRFSNYSFTFGASALASPTITNDARLNVTRTAVTSHWVETGDGGSTPVDLASIFPGPVPAGAVLYGFAIGGVGQILSGEASRSRQTQWQGVETLAWTKEAHALRIGADYKRLSPVRDRAASSIAGFYGSLSAVLANAPMMISQSQAEAASSVIDTFALFAQDTWRLGSRLTLNYGLRWEITPAPKASGPPLWPARYAQFAPRAGIAYRLGSATVLRAGWGIFYDAEFGAATDPINAFPYNRWQFATVFGNGAPIVPVSAPVTGSGFAPNLHLPYAREWNVALERAFGANVMSASYIGSQGRRLLRREAALNAGEPLALSPVATNNGRSDFHGFELHYRRRLASGWQGLASYTWSRAMDNGSWDSGLYTAGSAATDRGPAAFDVRQNFSAGLSWQLRHWSFSTLASARSGFPVDVLASENLLGLEFDDYPRPDRVTGVPLWAGDRLNPAAFTPPSAGRQGTLGRNSIRGFGMAQIDMAVTRDFAIREEGVLSLRLEAFNLTNHAQLADPVRFLDSPLFGRSVSMLNLMLGTGTPHSGIAPALQTGGPRVLQASVRFRF